MSVSKKAIILSAMLRKSFTVVSFTFLLGCATSGVGQRAPASTQMNPCVAIAEAEVQKILGSPHQFYLNHIVTSTLEAESDFMIFEATAITKPDGLQLSDTKVVTETYQRGDTCKALSVREFVEGTVRQGTNMSSSLFADESKRVIPPICSHPEVMAAEEKWRKADKALAGFEKKQNAGQDEDRKLSLREQVYLFNQAMQERDKARNEDFYLRGLHCK